MDALEHATPCGLPECKVVPLIAPGDFSLLAFIYASAFFYWGQVKEPMSITNLTHHSLWASPEEVSGPNVV